MCGVDKGYRHVGEGNCTLREGDNRRATIGHIEVAQLTIFSSMRNYLA